MTVTGLHEVTCPTCFQRTELLFRPEQQDYVLLTHKTLHGFKCASSGNAYSKELATKLLRGRGR